MESLPVISELEEVQSLSVTAIIDEPDNVQEEEMIDDI